MPTLWKGEIISLQLNRLEQSYQHPLSPALPRVAGFLFQANKLLDRYQLVTVA